MSCHIIVGLQWGDEGKGKIVDLLASEASHIVRSQGGHNAGHTVIFDGSEFQLHLIPSGILRPDKQCYLGAGVVIEPGQLLEEMKMLEERGLEVRGRLWISDRSKIILPYHIMFDELKERDQKIGTTRRGIGPCYQDGVGREGLLFGELVNRRVCEARLRGLLEKKNREIALLYGERGFDVEATVKRYVDLGQELAELVLPVEQKLFEVGVRGEKIILEGAQGTLLDVHFGTYPFVTSSQTIASGIAAGAGVGPRAVECVTGILKAYTTRVGEGPFPTEMSAEELKFFGDQKSAREVGTTTGRMRRIGWLDLPAVKYAVQINGVDQIALMKMDILKRLEKILVCVEYGEGGPVYEEWPYEEYVARLQAFLGVPVRWVSYGPAREETEERVQ